MVRMWSREYQNTVDVVMLLSVAGEQSYGILPTSV